MTGHPLSAAGAAASTASSAAPATEASLAAAIVIATVAALLFVGAIAAEDVLTPRRARTVRMASALVGYFALWTAFLGQAASRELVGIALFASSIGLFRLMRSFER